MKIIIRDTDTSTALLVARATINDILARRSPDANEKVPAVPQPLGPALSATALDAPQPVKQAPSPVSTGEPIAGSPPSAPAPDTEKRGRGRPRKGDVAVAKTYTLDEVRKHMVDLVQKHGQDMIDVQRQILASMGHAKVSELPVEQYGTFIDNLNKTAGAL